SERPALRHLARGAAGAARRRVPPPRRRGGAGGAVRAGARRQGALAGVGALVTAPADAQRRGAFSRIAFAVYVALTAYASLYPLEGWREHAASPFEYLFAAWPPRYVSRFDMAVNVLGYVPFGWLCAAALYPRVRGAAGFVVAALAGAALSILLEAADVPADARRVQPGRRLQRCRRRARRARRLAFPALDPRARAAAPAAQCRVPARHRGRSRARPDRALALRAAQSGDPALRRRQPARSVRGARGPRPPGRILRPRRDADGGGERGCRRPAAFLPRRARGA